MKRKETSCEATEAIIGCDREGGGVPDQLQREGPGQELVQTGRGNGYEWAGSCSAAPFVESPFHITVLICYQL